MTFHNPNGSAKTLSSTTQTDFGNPFLYTGRRYDAESGLYQYRARIYIPALGRFGSRDPLDYRAGDENLYRYCINDPLVYADPSGKSVMLVVFLNDWNPKKCPLTCKNQLGDGLNMSILEERAKRLKENIHNTKVDVVFREDCGGTGFSLKCSCKKKNNRKKHRCCVYKSVNIQQYMLCNSSFRT